MPEQGNLLDHGKTFDVFATYDMHKANDGLRAWAHGPQPLRLLFIKLRIKRIGNFKEEK